jgi:hypothetical protein
LRSGALALGAFILLYLFVLPFPRLLFFHLGLGIGLGIERIGLWETALQGSGSGRMCTIIII